MKNTILIDGNNLAMRNWHSNDAMCNSDGEGTGVIYGFYKGLLYSLEELKGSDVIVAWDKGKDFRKKLFRKYRDSFRHLDKYCRKDSKTYTDKLYEGYKGNRKTLENIDDFYRQVEQTKEFLTAIGIIQVEVSGVEADDIIYYLSKKIKHLTTVSSTDTDYLQMVYDNSNVHWITNKISNPAVFTKDNFSNMYNKLYGYPLERQSFLFFKSAVGDVSDNISGVSGIGERGLSKSLQDYNYKFFNFLASDDTKAKKIRKQKDIFDFCVIAISLKYAYKVELKELLDNHINLVNPKRDVDKIYKIAKHFELHDFINNFDKYTNILRG